MGLLLSGISFGLVLSLMVGPIFFALIQTVVERGTKAGIILSFGVWLSDFLFIILVYSGITYVAELIAWEGFKKYLGIGGGLILIAFGLGSILIKPKLAQNMPPAILLPRSFSALFPAKTNQEKLVFFYISLWLKGLLINSVNPFTVIFWAGVTTNVVVRQSLTNFESFLFFGGLWGTIVFTDVLKILLARWIKRSMQPSYLLSMRRISGMALVVFGLVLILRVLIWEN